MIFRNKETVFLEFEQLLNLLFGNSERGAWLWKEEPFLQTVKSFCLDATALTSRQELRDWVLGDWMFRRRETLTDDAQDSVRELLKVALS